MVSCTEREKEGERKEEKESERERKTPTHPTSLPAGLPAYLPTYLIHVWFYLFGACLNAQRSSLFASNNPKGNLRGSYNAALDAHRLHLA